MPESKPELPTEIEMAETPLTKEEESRALSRAEVTQSYWSLVRHQFRKNKIAMFAVYMIGFLFFLAIFADMLANDVPLYTSYEGSIYFPVFHEYAVGLGLANNLKFDWKELIRCGSSGSE